MEYPESVLTKSKKGKIEVRSLIDSGKFTRYEYLDPKTGKKSENKFKLVLKGKKQEEFFVIPISGGRFLLVPSEAKGKRKIWDGKKAIKI